MADPHSSNMSSNSSRTQLLPSIRADIKERSIQKDGELVFITNADLKEIWTESLIEKLFGDQPWSSELFSGRPVLEQIRICFWKVLSILVYIGWADLSSFSTEFVFHLNDDGEPDRRDQELPLSIKAIGQYHNADILARDFLRDQYKFIPIVIQEGGDPAYPTDKYILPFMNGAKQIGRGSFFHVYAATIPSGQFLSYEYQTPNSDVLNS